MRLRLEDKNKAMSLRKNGYTYSEIMRLIPNLPKSTLSNWVQNITLTNQDKDRIRQKALLAGTHGRLIGAWRNKEKAQNRILKIQLEAEREYRKLKKSRLFNAGLILYWGEGSKKSRMFQFMNSDSRTVKIMLRWLREAVHVPEDDIKIRLFTHKVYYTQGHQQFWLHTTGVGSKNFLKTVYKPTKHKVAKNENYKGCCRIEISKSKIYWKTVKWIDLLSDDLLPS